MRFLRAILTLCLLLVGPVCAASADALRIKLAQDISLGTWNGSGQKVGLSDVCIYYDLGTDYVVSATTATGSYLLHSGGNSVAFEVYFKDSSGASGSYTQLPYNTTRSFTNADQSAQTCGGSYNANLKVVVPNSGLSAAAPGSYSGTLTITLAPN